MKPQVRAGLPRTLLGRENSTALSRPARSRVRGLSAAVLLWAGVLGAAEPTDQGVVSSLERRYNRARTLEADFVQRYTLGRSTRVESGRVYFQKPGRMRWEYNSPEEKLFLTDGRYAYLYVPREQQVRRQPLPQTPEWQAAFALLLGRVKLERVFDRVQLVPILEPQSPARWQVRARPRSQKQAFDEVWLDLSDAYQLLRLEIRQRDGSLLEFHFRRWQENHPLDGELFRLRVPPGTAWLDAGPS